MLFDISELDPRGVGLDCTVEVSPFAWESGESVTCDPVHLIGTLKPTRRGVELAGQFVTTAHRACDRCLSIFDAPLDERFRVFLKPPPADGEESEYEEIPEDDPDAVDLYPLEGTVVDLAAVLQEQVDLALPMRALCRDDCRGLCSGCGADLNREECRCEPEHDERFAGLEQLKIALERRRAEAPIPGRERQTMQQNAEQPRNRKG